MITHEQSKKEILKDKVVSLVKEFVKTEGGISWQDLQILFGNPFSLYSEVATALAELSILLTGQKS